MKNIIKISAALPFLLFAAGCSDKENDPRFEGDYDVVLSVDAGATRAVGSLDGSAAENAFSGERLYFGTFDTAGALMHSLYENKVPNNDLKVTYFTPNWGPSIACKLPRATYAGKDFYIGAFSMPTEFTEATFRLAGLGSMPNNDLQWKGTQANNYVWAPNGTDKQIPMSGVLQLTSAYMDEHYNETVFGHTPMRLPDIPLQRVMAKIIIEDPDNIIESAELKTPTKGALLPFFDSILDETKMEPARPAGGTEYVWQKLTTPNGKNGEMNQYIFYTFEDSFLTYGADGKSNGIKAATHVDREIIRLHANADSGLQGNRATTTVNFAPHTDRVATGSGDALMAADNGLWRGVMRNTVYTFRVYRPSAGNVDILVSAEPMPWIHHDKEDFDF